MPPGQYVRLPRAAARDLLVVLERVEATVADIGLLFDLDGAIRLLTAQLFGHLPEADAR